MFKPLLISGFLRANLWVPLTSSRGSFVDFQGHCVKQIFLIIFTASKLSFISFSGLSAVCSSLLLLLWPVFSVTGSTEETVWRIWAHQYYPLVEKDKLNGQNDRGGYCRGWSNLCSISYRGRSIIVPPGLLQCFKFFFSPVGCAFSCYNYIPFWQCVLEASHIRD